MTPHSDDEVTISPGVLEQLGIPGHQGPSESVAIRDIGGASRQGHRRHRNEDAWGFRDATAFVVADGMGGRPGGDRAAQIAVDTLLDTLNRDVVDWRRPVETANAAVSHSRLPEDGPCGAVVVALRCAGDRASILHLGDARAYRLRDGLAEPLTRDHSVAEAVNGVGLRRSESGLEPRQLAAVTSFLGDQDAWREYTVRELTIRPGDRIVLTSDGVHQHLTASAWALACDVEGAGDTAEFLVTTAQAAGSNDDATALVVDLDVTNSVGASELA